MQINTLKIKIAKKRRKTIGRGGKKGSSSGKGGKGQKGRSGVSIDPLFEGGRSSLIDRLKKVRGFKSFKLKPVVLSLSRVQEKFKTGDTVSKKSLISAGLLKKRDVARKIKVLNSTDLKIKLIFTKEISVSSSSRKAVEKAGGEIESGEKTKK